MTEVQEVRQEIVAEAIINGLSRPKALKKAGYSDNTAMYHGKKTLKYLKVDEYLREWRETQAQHQLQRLTKQNTSDIMLNKVRIELEKDEPNFRKVKAWLDSAKLTTARSQDLLDRAGVSKISKSMRVNVKADYKTLVETQARIQELRQELGQYDKTETAKRAEAEVDEQVIVDTSDV